MKRIFRKLFPNQITRADLTTVEADLGAQLNALRSRLDVLAASQGIIHESNEIAINVTKGRVTALEGGLELAIRRLNAFDAVQRQIEDRVFENLPLTPNGRATRTEIVEIKPKGRGPKGAK